MKKTIVGLVFVFLSTIWVGTGAFATESMSKTMGKSADYGQEISRFGPDITNTDSPGGEPDSSFRRALGDLGKPADYDQTIKRFRDSISDFDAFVDEALPSAFDWRTSGMVTPADDQGDCGSCWAFASVGAVEAKILIGGGSQYDLSEQQVISCNGYGYDCCGGSMDSLNFWDLNNGPMQESCTDYGDYNTDCPPTGSNVTCSSMDSCTKLKCRTTGYYTVDTSDPAEVKTSLYNDGPSYFRYDFYDDFYTHWSSASAGTAYTQSSGTKLGGHAVLIIGWDDSKAAWLCKNSWGPTGGPDSDGTFWMSYTGHTEDLNFGMANVQVVCGASSCELINDGSFENGPPPGSAWTEWENSGLPSRILDPTSYSGGVGSYNGTYSWWGGGYTDNTPVSGYVQQDIAIPNGATQLSFYTVLYRQDNALDDLTPDDVFTVSVNGTPIFSRNLLQYESWPNWVEQVVDISTYAGQSVTLKFNVESVGEWTGNVLVDYIRVCIPEGGPGSLPAIFLLLLGD